MVRRTMGRQKIEIKKIEKKNDLQVAFSKRRNGLFKKASELGTLCNAQVAVVLFSPGGKAYSFGHPGVKPIIDRFLLKHPPPQYSSGAISLAEGPSNPNIDKLNKELEEVLNQLEAEKKYGKELEEMRRADQTQRWWEAPVEELSVDQLEQQQAALQDLKNNVIKQVEMLNNGVGTSATPWAIQPYSGYPQANMVNGIGTAAASWPIQELSGYLQTEMVNGNGTAAGPWPLLEYGDYPLAENVNGIGTAAAPWPLQDYNGNLQAEMINGNGTPAAPWPLQQYGQAGTVNGIGTAGAPWSSQEYGGYLQAGSANGSGTPGAPWSSQEYNGNPQGRGHGQI
ncbi:Transcription factor, MADS-box [Dillenia turbinata]|uniref:Transcription factor, MADS-box n=1 Tax=Dillenia turbinata TaxID=194707 RepID=A0AAN8UVM5_9MAGN